jgi:hypothetical protein
LFESVEVLFNLSLNYNEYFGTTFTGNFSVSGGDWDNACFPQAVRQGGTSRRVRAFWILLFCTAFCPLPESKIARTGARKPENLPDGLFRHPRTGISNETCQVANYKTFLGR